MESRYLPSLAMFYVTIKVLTVLMIYKIITFYGLPVSASTFIIPMWFIIGDIIAEIYGYKIAKRLVWLALACQFLFAFIAGAFSYIPSPAVVTNHITYDTILRKLPRVAIASFIGIVVGGLFNAYIISKWKFLLRGKYFMLRSFGASTLGELLFTICVYCIEFFGLTANSNIVMLAIDSYLIKIVINALLTIPAGFVVTFLKHKEGFYGANTSPSSFKLTELYAKEDGLSYFKTEFVDTPVEHFLGNYSIPIDVSKMSFRNFQSNNVFEQHTAPREQYIIYLEGEVEVKASSGETRVFKSGDILLARDTQGQGHITITRSQGRSVIVAI